MRRGRNFTTTMFVSLMFSTVIASCAASQDLSPVCTVEVEIDADKQVGFAEDVQSYALSGGMEYVLRLEPLMRPTRRFGLRNGRVEISGRNTVAEEKYRFFFFATDASAETEAREACASFRAFTDALAYRRTTSGDVGS